MDCRETFSPLRAVCHTFPLTPRCQAAFCHSLHRLSHHCGCGAQLYLVVGWLEPSGTGCVQHRTALASPQLLSGCHHSLPHICLKFLVSKRTQLHIWHRKVNFHMFTLPNVCNYPVLNMFYFYHHLCVNPKWLRQAYTI